MKKIAYIEIDTHAEIAADFMDLMEDSKEISVDYYFSKKIDSQIPSNQENVFLSDSSMILEQLKAKKYDFVMIGTAHRYFDTFLEITRKYKSAIIVHNLNFSKTSPLNLIKSILRSDQLFRLKLLLKEGLLQASTVYKNAAKLFVLDEALSSQTYAFLPLFYSKEFVFSKNQKLTVVIPGGVSQKRRDYDHVLDCIQKSEEAKKLEFVFLGKAKGEELEKIKKVSGNFSFKYFTERVSQENFEFWMEKADVLWCPIQEKTEFFSQKEIYGKTKMTGNLGDAIKFGKTAVFPENYPSDLAFIVPEKKDVILQLNEIKDFQFNFQKEFNKKRVLQKLEEKLLQVT